jgi:hypothetical protein
MATITTVIPVYNGEKHILETLRSLARQTVRPDRVVVVDDGSKDRTEQIVRGFTELPCDWRPNEKNVGLFPNHNSALRFAGESDYFHILHANDLVRPNFFESLVPLIENAPGFALAYSGHVFIREDGAETDRQGGIAGSGPRRLSMREFLGSQSELQAIQLHSAVMKTSRQQLPIAFRLDIPQSADVVFHSEFAALCSEIWARPERLALVRLHEGSASSQNSKNLKAWVHDEWRTMQIANALMKQKGLGSAMHDQKLKLLFAARTQVKAKSVKAENPTYAAEIRAAAIDATSPLHWLLAGAVVAARDTFVSNRAQTH